MRQIIVESNLEEKFGALPGQAIVCDSQQRVLGLFSPLPDRPQIEDLQLEPPLSIAQLEELRKVQIGKPLGDILNELSPSR